MIEQLRNCIDSLQFESEEEVEQNKSLIRGYISNIEIIRLNQLLVEPIICSKYGLGQPESINAKGPLLLHRP